MKNSFKFASFIAAIGCSILSASAATFYWDAGTVTVNGASEGGTGAWTVGAAGWENGTSAQNWANGNAAVFGGTAGTVTLGGAISATSATFSTAGYVVDAAGFNLTLTSGASGSASTIKLSNGSKLTSGSGITVNSSVDLGTGGGKLAGGTGNYGIYTGKVTGGTAGTTSLTIDGGHTHLDNAANDFAGNILVSGYYLKTSQSEVIPDAAVITLNATTAFKINPGSAGTYTETIGGVNSTSSYGVFAEGSGVNATLRIGQGDASSSFGGSTYNFGQVGGATLSLVKIGTGTLTLTSGAANSGSTTLSAGTLITNGNLGSAVTINDAITGANNTSLLLGNLTMNRAVTIANYGGTTTLGVNGSVANPEFSGAITLAKDVILDGGTNTDRFTFTGGIGGTGNVTIGGTGRVMFRGTNANSFNGNLTINNGSTLQLNWNGNENVSYIPDSSVVTINGTLKLAKTNISETIGGLSGSGTLQGHEGVTNTASALVVNNSSNHTFSGILSNGGASGSTLSLTKTGPGTQTLSGANTYTGATSINGGTLALTGTATLPSSTITVASGAFLDVSGLTGGFTLGNGKTLKGEGSVTGDVSEDADAGEVGVITAGNGTSGTLTIDGNLTFNELADVNIGALANYTSTPALAVTGNVTVASAAGEIYINLPIDPVSPGTYRLISHANTLADIDAFTLGTAPLLSSRQVGNLVNNAGSIDYVVSGANPVWTGALGSSWTTASQSAPKNWTLPGGGATDYLEGDVVFFNDTATTTTVDLALDVNPTSVSFDHSAKNYTLQSTGGFAIASGTLAKTGTGILTITNANTFTGDATLSAGTVQVGNDSALGSGNLVLNGGTLASDSTTARTLANTGATIGGDVTLGDTTDNGPLTLTGNVNLNTGTRVLTTESDTTIAGSITNGSLTKEGAGTLTLTGSNSYSNTAIYSGTLKIGAGGGTGSTGTGAITNNAALVVDHSGTPSIGGAIDGTGSLTVNGGGTLTLSGQNTYTGNTTINGSTLNLGMGESYNTSHVGSLVTINSGGTLRLNAKFQTGFAYGFASSGTPADITINAGGTFDKNSQATYIKNLTMNGNSAVIGAGATAGDNLQLCANLTATSTAAGAPSISGINLVAGSYTNAGNTRTIDITHGAGATSTDDLTIGVIGQQTPGAAASMIKTGNGTLKLTGANTYGGSTTVNQGTLKGATSFAGTLAVQSGTTLAPGDGIGTLAANATTLAGTYVCEVDATTSDVLAVTGNLDLTGSTFTLSGTPAASSYTIATYTGTLTGTFTESPALPSGYSLNYATPGQIKLVSTAGYSSWAATNAPGQTLDQDHDGDGVSNGVEYFMGLSGSGFTANPAPNASNVISWPKGGSYTGIYNTDFVVQISTDLAIWTDVAPADVSDTSGSVEYDLDTLPAGVKKFARLKVTGP